jgi:hypothetical protein
MSKSKTREDKTCLNCKHVVEKRFCGNCGQENINTRKTFHHLFVHFFEDLTHYENAFWKTIKNLLIKPSNLSKEYLSGKRLSYLAPVRLYIFISFVTFFLMAIFPNANEESKFIKFKETEETTTSENVISEKEKKLNELLETDIFTSAQKDSIKKIAQINNGSSSSYNIFGYKSVKELDSIQKFGEDQDKVPSIVYPVVKKSIIISEKYSNEEIREKIGESLFHNFPKVLIVYMPIFAFFLWLFHNKKKWYYFDHGIFTLHYFSFLLLIALIPFLTTHFIALFGDNIVAKALISIIKIICLAWMVYYFFPAHHRFYGESRTISFLKSSILFIINMIFMFILFLSFFVYSFITLH